MDRDISGYEIYKDEKPFLIITDPNNISYNEFINKIITNNTIAIEMTPTIDHEYCDYNNPLSGRDRDEPYCLQSAPIWIKFSLKESKEAIEKLGREL